MWNNPLEIQGFALATADGTVLAELPPTMHFQSAVGRPEAPKPLEPRTTTPLERSRTQAVTETVVEKDVQSVADVFGTKTSTTEETRTVDHYTWERAPFSSTWFRLGDGLPQEKPPEPSTVTTKTTADGKVVTETVQTNVSMVGDQQTTTTTRTVNTAAVAGGSSTTTTSTVTTGTETKTVTKTVQVGAVANGRQETTTTTTTTTTPTAPATVTYIATPPYWGHAPTVLLLTTADIQAAYEAAYASAIETGKPVWVVEHVSGGDEYRVLDKLDAPPPPQIVLTGNWYYDGGGDEALMHGAEIERACALAAQLMFRGRKIADFTPAKLNLFQMQTADKMRDVTYTLTLFTTEYFTAQEFMRRQMT